MLTDTPQHRVFDTCNTRIPQGAVLLPKLQSDTATTPTKAYFTNVFNNMSSEQKYFENLEVGSVPKAFNCEICTYPMVNPQITNPCGHALCGHCADRLSGGSRTCHMCRQPRTGFCRNIFAEQLLANVKVKCKSCNEDVPLNVAQQHVTVHCQEMEINCTQCQASIKRKEADVHNSSCPKGEIICECGFKMCRGDGEQHQKDCKMADVDCRLGCGATIKRYLLPSHCLGCPKVVEQCPVTGCGQSYKREEIQAHLTETLERHFHLTKREKARILWQSAKGQLGVVPQRSTNEQFVVTWSPLPASQTGVFASPVFHKLDRKWRMYYDKGELRLQYVQGVDDVAVVASFFMKTRDGKMKAVRELTPFFILLKEGGYIEINTNSTNPPEAITAKIELVNPTY